MEGSKSLEFGAGVGIDLRRQELCRQLHAKIDAAEEEKYDMEIRVQKSTKEVRAGTARGPGAGPIPDARPSSGDGMRAWGAGAPTVGKACGTWGVGALAAGPIPDARPSGREGTWARGMGA